MARWLGQTVDCRDGCQLQISIEKFEDVAFEAAGSPTKLIQTKHHIGKGRGYCPGKNVDEL
jgi:hypothetical protein